MTDQRQDVDPAAASQSPRRRSVWRDKVLWAIFTAAAVLFATYSWLRHRRFETAGYDLGIFDQVVRAYASFQAPIVTLKGDDYNIWGDHFHPLVALWAPLYWIWDDPRMLLVAQAVLAASAIFPVYSFCSRRLSTPWSYLVTAGFVLGWPIQGLIDFDVHEIVFAVPLLAWAIDALDRRSDRQLLIAAGLLLLVREDMGVVVALIGVIRWIWADGQAIPWRRWWEWVRRRRPAPGRDHAGGGRAAGGQTGGGQVGGGHTSGSQASGGQAGDDDTGLISRWPGLILAGGGLVVFMLVTLAVIPAFSAEGYAYWDYPALGAGPGEALISALTKPWLVIQGLLLPGQKTVTLLWLLLPLFGLPLLSRYALPAYPILAARLLADRSTLWTTHFHYNAPIWALFVLAAVEVLGRDSVRARWVRLPRMFAVWLAALAAAGLAGWFGIGSQFPMHKVINGDQFRMPLISQQRAAVRAQIPDHTCVAADDRIAGHLTRTNRVTLPGISQRRQDFYVVDMSQPVPGTTPDDWTSWEVFRRAYAMGYREVFRSGPISLLRSPEYNGPSLECAPP